ncbi:hypothetical protein [Neobacillus ginsengisoli]|uniref:Uncharacterized protein n=1 Tax=Neobacillus ginsengisoli TaxID=904295 RepID=A0ABT9XZ68_9BACI|nr:hypothetical protein [Neobacillus ginsengisoli]MDQ0200771.1 hypothetical protein [Neobacillus ginsengisoli]
MEVWLKTVLSVRAIIKDISFAVLLRDVLELLFEGQFAGFLGGGLSLKPLCENKIKIP